MLKRSLKHVLRAPLRKLRAYQAKATALEMSRKGPPALAAIGAGLSELLVNELSEEERHWAELIERRRSQLSGSFERISVVDYGAGAPTSGRTKTEMDRGVETMETVSEVCSASKPPFWALMLLKLVRKLKPKSILELGSCVGISAAYQAAALKMNGNGHIVTLEGSPEVAKIARETLSILGLTNASVTTGPFHETLGDALESSKPVDFFFNDGHHDHDAVIRYFEEALPYLSDHAVIVFDDIAWSDGMKRAWQEIEADERVSVSIDLQKVGVAVIDKGVSRKTKYHIRIPR